jgi:hypothetical protein
MHCSVLDRNRTFCLVAEPELKCSPVFELVFGSFIQLKQRLKIKNEKANFLGNNAVYNAGKASYVQFFYTKIFDTYMYCTLPATTTKGFSVLWTEGRRSDGAGREGNEPGDRARQRGGEGRVSDPDQDPDWIRIQSGQWIRIQEGKNDPQK